MATDTRSAILAITGRRVEIEALDAALRFSAVVRNASALEDGRPALAACATFAARAFGGEADAWAPLVAAVRDLLTGPLAPGAGALRSQRELRAFVAENADLLDR